MDIFSTIGLGIVLLLIGMVMLFSGHKCKEDEDEGTIAFFFIGGTILSIVGMAVLAGVFNSLPQTHDKNEVIYLKNKKELNITDKEYKNKDNNIAMAEVREAVAKKLNINKDDVIIEKENDKDNRYIATTSLGVYYVQTSEGTVNVDGIVKK
ncbi:MULTISPECIES: hypothetical protein [Bacillus]|uniref:Uncharacterized protein n=2 Tax=Bacillus thuringiensis TaxID=1428 RepID=A0AAP4Q664_BACTU|nr:MULTISPECIES: hypothetical protein [Bacillus]MEC0046429.1 hypothetical protein [Bacillus cereus]AFV21794.1 hypothetical protein BTB_502p04890 [Bacillus thuringiensis Bt407]EEM25179.1 hypothetical protein bthur0002_58210 [Bacillus thuringiensis Bt407]ERI01029.1 hypothetical protein BTCBT_002584 [Bacillus thuringiensis T01-328]MBN6707791.1 hypothetical protein [Bacillus thuringiensis]